MILELEHISFIIVMTKKMSLITMLISLVTFILYSVTFSLIFFAKIEMGILFYVALFFNVVALISNFILEFKGIENTSDKAISQYNIFINICLLIGVIYMLNHFILIVFLICILLLLLQLSGIIFLLLMFINAKRR